MHGNAQRWTSGISPAHFFHEDGLIPIIDPAAAVLLGIGESEQSQIAHFFEQVMGGKHARRFPFFNVGVDFGFDKFAHHLAKGVVFVCEK